MKVFAQLRSALFAHSPIARFRSSFEIYTRPNVGGNEIA